MHGFSRRLFCTPTFIAMTATVLRLLGLIWAFRFRPWLVVGPSTGGEVAQIARSIVLGRGFGNPLGVVITGPTAWLCPVYPYIVAGAYKVAGIYTGKSRLLLLALNCVFAGLTVFPIYAIARRSFGTTTAVCAAWMWVVLPVAWHIPIRLAWDSTLNALSFAVLFWATLAVLAQRRLLLWVGYGALWAISALINASVLSLAPFFFGWLLWELRKESAQWLRPLATAALVFALGLAPWTIRNYLAFGRFVLIRSNFGLVLWMGNHPGPYGFDQTLSPFANAVPAADYVRMGEMAFMADRKQKAYSFMRAHPGRTMGLTLRNVWKFWLDVTDHEANPWYGDSQRLNVRFFSNAVLVMLALAGTIQMLRQRSPASPLYLSVVLFFPLVYYVTRPGIRFRFAIEPILTILAAYGAVCIFQLIQERRLRTREVQQQSRAIPTGVG
jgi:4-amino-4-deoxy-L-arabinose transferase-like glycosyltransferase